MTGQLHIKRIYEPASGTDGQRVLVDRVWPRGVSREAARLTLWLKEIAPTAELRKWFGHVPERWEEFRKRYREELGANTEAVVKLRAMLKQGDVTLLYGARDTKHNQAVVIKDYLAAIKG